MPYHQAALVIGLSLLMLSEAFAQPVRVQEVCWGDSWAVCNYLERYRPFRFFGCWSGGSSGFNRVVVCNAVCGTADPNLCKISTGTGGPDGECGYRLATVFCGFTKSR
jgi:hypothetical protein